VLTGTPTGTTRLLVTNRGGTGAITTNGIQIVQVQGTSTASNFTLAKPVQAGAFEYLLQRGGRTDGDANSFYLSSRYINPPSATADPEAPEILRPAVPAYVMGPAAINDLAQGLLGQGALGSLHQRVGEQQTLKWDDCGCTAQPANTQVWGRLTGTHLTLEGERQFGVKQDMFFAQFGKDLAVRYSGVAGDKSRTHTGLSAAYGQVDADFNDRARAAGGLGGDTGKMKGQILTLGAYHTRYADNGSYLDLVGQLHAARNTFRDKYNGEATQKGYGGGLSVEGGRPWQIGASPWLIEPQGQLSWLATRYQGFEDTTSTVEGMTSQSLRARLGMRLAWNQKANRDDGLTRTNTVYFTANVMHEFKDNTKATVGQTEVNDKLGKPTWAEIGLGGQVPINKTAYLYGGAQYQQSISGDSRRGGSAQIGVRAMW
jgi:outer membrane autotransporter protein